MPWQALVICQITAITKRPSPTITDHHSKRHQAGALAGLSAAAAPQGLETHGGLDPVKAPGTPQQRSELMQTV